MQAVLPNRIKYYKILFLIINFVYEQPRKNVFFEKKGLGFLHLNYGGNTIDF